METVPLTATIIHSLHKVHNTNAHRTACVCLHVVSRKGWMNFSNIWNEAICQSESYPTPVLSLYLQSVIKT
jgi:hypothetical protein